MKGVFTKMLVSSSSPNKLITTIPNILRNFLSAIDIYPAKITEMYHLTLGNEPKIKYFYQGGCPVVQTGYNHDYFTKAMPRMRFVST